MKGELEKRVERLREEETRLSAVCDERQRQKTALESDFHTDDVFRQVRTYVHIYICVIELW